MQHHNNFNKSNVVYGNKSAASAQHTRILQQVVVRIVLVEFGLKGLNVRLACSNSGYNELGRHRL